MKKTLGTYFSQYFKMPHLYRDDVEAIEKIIRTQLQPKKYILTCGGFEYEELQDIVDVDPTHVLVIYTHSPCMRLKFARSWTELYSGDDGTGMDQAIREIAQVVSRAERRWLWRFCISSSWLAPLVGFGSFAVVFGSISVGLLPLRATYLVASLLIIMSIWWGAGYHYRLQGFSCIDLGKPRGETSWWIRQRKPLLISSSSLTLGALLTWLLTRYF